MEGEVGGPTRWPVTFLLANGWQGPFILSKRAPNQSGWRRATKRCCTRAVISVLA